MADDQATHVDYKGRHYIFPGKLTAEDAATRVRNLARGGPKISPGPPSSGFEDTSEDAASVLARYHEPNRARDVLPRLAMFAANASLAAAPEALALKAAGLKGLPFLQKLAIAGKASAKAGAYGVAGAAEDKALRAAGVPAGVSEAIVAATGLATKPGRAMIKAGAEALAGESAVLPAGERAMATNLGGIAKPGPAATPPSELEAQLQATLDAIKAKKAGALQPERIQVGAQKVGRKLGMTKEQVRMEAGPVLNEELGSASPVLPRQAINSIAEKIKTLPKGDVRDAYVALANSDKAMWNIEVIRRTLESQGLVLPFAAVAGLVIEEQSKGGR
jgi:hypothetical protein